jgi:hypothetical protein
LTPANPNPLGNTNLPITAKSIKLLPEKGSGITKMKEQLDDSNWVTWCEQIHRIFALCGVNPYVYGKLPRPDPEINPDMADIWDMNDMYAQILITNNISKDQMVHVSRLNTAREIWKSLEAIHETHDYQIAIAVQRATKDDDIVEHLTRLKKQWERLNVLDDDDFRITETQFKMIIASSLPKSWDTFTEPYIGRHKGVIETDQRKYASSQELIGIIKEESIRRKGRKERETVMQVAEHSPPKPSTSASNRAKQKGPDNRLPNKPTRGKLCKNCGGTSHTTDECYWLGKARCATCHWFHKEGPCRKRKTFKEGDQKGKHPKKEEIHNVVKTANADKDIVYVITEDACNNTKESRFGEKNKCCDCL